MIHCNFARCMQNVELTSFDVTGKFETVDFGIIKSSRKRMCLCKCKLLNLGSNKVAMAAT